MAKIKICGLRTLADVKIVNELKPDFVGFILSDGFKRTIDKDTAQLLKGNLNKDIKVVGVFVNDSIDNIQYYLDKNIIDIVQLHGNESVDYISQLNATVIKVLKPSGFDKITQYENCVDYFLFDSGTGTGKTFDWSLLPQTNKPFFLAGGLSKDNLNDAIKNINPFAVDMSSSVETDGKKDYDKVKEVIDIIRSNK